MVPRWAVTHAVLFMFYAELNSERTQRGLMLFINSSVLLVEDYMHFRDSLLHMDICYLINTTNSLKKFTLGF